MQDTLFINGFLERTAINKDETETEAAKMAESLWENFWHGADRET